MRTDGVAARTVATQGTVDGGIDQVGRSSDLSQVSTAVRQIVDRNFSNDTEVLLFCMKAFGNDPGSGKPRPRTDLRGLSQVPCREGLSKSTSEG